MERGPEPDAPLQITRAKATPFAKGELKSTLTFTTPTESFAGDKLSALTSVEICNSAGELLGSVADVEPGKEYSWVDQNALQGVNDYLLYACNEAGRGGKCEVSVYVGNDIPYAVTSMEVGVDDNHIVNVKWGKPTEVGINGGYVNPDKLTYNFTRSDYNPNSLQPVSGGTGLKKTEFTYDETAADGKSQSAYYYGVSPVNDLGEGYTAVIPVVLGKTLRCSVQRILRRGNHSFRLLDIIDFGRLRGMACCNSQSVCRHPGKR